MPRASRSRACVISTSLSFAAIGRSYSDGQRLPTLLVICCFGPWLTGCRLIVGWTGRRAVEHGFAWNGNTYPSLSKVAFAVTGTRWNGPKFFGLRDKPAKASSP